VDAQELSRVTGRLGGLTAWANSRPRMLAASSKGGRTTMARHGGRAWAYRLALKRWHPELFEGERINGKRARDKD